MGYINTCKNSTTYGHLLSLVLPPTTWVCTKMQIKKGIRLGRNSWICHKIGTKFFDGFIGKNLDWTLTQNKELSKFWTSWKKRCHNSSWNQYFMENSISLSYLSCCVIIIFGFYTFLREQPFKMSLLEFHSLKSHPLGKFIKWIQEKYR